MLAAGLAGGSISPGFAAVLIGLMVFFIVGLRHSGGGGWSTGGGGFGGGSGGSGGSWGGGGGGSFGGGGASGSW